MNANGLYSGVEGYVIPGTNSGVGGGVANGVYGDPDNVVSIVKDSLRIYLDPYNYEIGGSTWNDLSGNGSNATLFNSPVYDRTLGGKFICNRGGVTNQYISIPNPGTTGNHSVSLWVKFNGTFSNSSVVLEYGGAGNFPFRILESTVGTILNITSPPLIFNIDTTRFINDRWYNFTLVRDGLTANANGVGLIYLDGNLLASQVGVGASITTVMSLNAAGGSSPSTNNEYGVFMFYTKPLTPSEVKQNYFALKKRYNIL